MSGRIFTIGQPVIGRDRNDNPTYGTFAGVTPYGHAVIEVKIVTRHNGEIIGVDYMHPQFSMSDVYPQD